MKNKMIVAVSLVAAGVSDLSHVFRIDEGFTISSLGSLAGFSNDVLACQRRFEIFRDEKGV